MPSFSKGDVIFVRYPFSDLSGSKVRPALVVQVPHPSRDHVIAPLTSRLSPLQPGEFVLTDWASAGLNVPSAFKRGLYTVHMSLILKHIGTITARDMSAVEQSLRLWLGL
ncbi:MAG: type II toxin-antitoxin system PemK/MazF family toxin [Anaerolineae bacterium]